MSNSTISSNSALNGGGIFSTLGGTVNLSDSTLNGNSASLLGYKSFSYGGGISNGGNLTITNCTISGNSNTDSTLANIGGGIYNSKSGTITVNSSTINGNSASNNSLAVSGGGIDNDGIMTVSNCTISGNSTSGNTAENSGGGIFNYGNLTVSNCTISGNSISGKSLSEYLKRDPGFPVFAGAGGGISNEGNLTLLFSTLTLNQANIGGGVYNFPPNSAAIVRNTIIASNLLNTDGINLDVSGNFTSNGYNLIGDSTGSTGFGSPGDIVGTSDNPIDPRLAPLDFNGGSTQTIALLPDSPAIDAGDPTVLDTDPTTDQRGFPRVINGRSDIGAFEFF